MKAFQKMAAKLFIVKKMRVHPAIYVERCEAALPGLKVTAWTTDLRKARTFTIHRARAVARRNDHCGVAVAPRPPAQ